MYSRHSSIVGIPSVSTVYGAPVTVEFCTGDIIMGKPLPEVVYSSVLLIFVRCRTQTQLNHTFIVVGWVGERRGGEGRGEEGREEGRREEGRGGKGREGEGRGGERRGSKKWQQCGWQSIHSPTHSFIPCNSA